MELTEERTMPSERLVRAFEQSANYYDSAPRTLKASPWAWYMVLYGTEDRQQDITIQSIDRIRKAEGYRGRNAVNRYEEEVLKPMVVQLEADLSVDRQQQPMIDDVVEHILHGVSFREEDFFEKEPDPGT